MENKKKFRLVDTVGKDITVKELIDKYLNLPEQCFIKDWYPPTLEEQALGEEQATITKNIQYSYIQKNVVNPPPHLSRILSEITKNVTEENNMYADQKPPPRPPMEDPDVDKEPWDIEQNWYD